LNKVFAINKPKGPTSNDVLNQIRKILGTKKVGHAGTLDPLASGVLVVGVGPGTKELSKGENPPAGGEKEYIADIFLGATSTTDDAEGATFTTPQKHHTDKLEIVSMSFVEKTLKRFVGKIYQTPPIYSAIKIKGKEAYKYARAGKKIEMKPRQVEIKLIETLEYKWPKLKLRVVTGPGVYIRSLARDIGESLGCGGYLSDLVRTRVGDYRLENALPISKILHEK
jgi:tRNA pseudouridine55 synthase